MLQPFDSGQHHLKKGAPLLKFCGGGGETPGVSRSPGGRSHPFLRKDARVTKPAHPPLVAQRWKFQSGAVTTPLLVRGFFGHPRCELGSDSLPDAFWDVLQG